MLKLLFNKVPQVIFGRLCYDHTMFKEPPQSSEHLERRYFALELFFYPNITRLLEDEEMALKKKKKRNKKDTSGD